MRRSTTRPLLAALVAGCLAFTPSALAKPKPDKGVEKGMITALSYNVAGLPEQLSGSEPATNSSLISPLLDDYDLVLLQENWQDTLHDQREAGLVGNEVPPVMYHHLVVEHATHEFRSIPKPHPNGVDPDRAPSGPPTISDGLNRLSTAAFEPQVTRVAWEQCYGELTTSGVESLLGATGLDDGFDAAGLGVVNHETDGGAADCGAQKGFSVARTEFAPGVVVDVYNLHADAGSHERDIAARADNFRQLAAFIDDHSAGRAVILAGDTNLKIDRDDRVVDADVWHRFQAATGVVDVCALLDCGDDDAVIDKFAVRSGGGVMLTPTRHSFERARFTRADGEALSDHDPLAVTIEWKTAKPKKPKKATEG